MEREGSARVWWRCDERGGEGSAWPWRHSGLLEWRWKKERSKPLKLAKNTFRTALVKLHNLQQSVIPNLVFIIIDVKIVKIPYYGTCKLNFIYYFVYLCLMWEKGNQWLEFKNPYILQSGNLRDAFYFPCSYIDVAKSKTCNLLIDRLIIII